MKEVFNTAKKSNKEQDSFITDVKGINVNFISNGYNITTLVFYF